MGDREVSIRLRADISQYSRQLATAAAETQAFGRSTSSLKGPLGDVERQSSSTGKEIDKLSGRLRLATDAALILGPALGPLGAAAVGGVVALSAQLGALAGALGVTVLATKGLGDGLKALDEYQLKPTTENFAKLQAEMEKLGPAGEDFVRFLDSIEPNLKSLQTAAREGLLPGAQEGIEGLMQRLPELRKLIREVAETTGDLFAGGGQAIGGERFDAFFNYLKTDGIQILEDTGKTIGNLTESVANLFAAFGGVSTDFSGGLLKFSEGLAEASSHLESSAGFQEFVDYIETEGPHALETLGSIANMFLQIVEATAPLGGPVLTILGQVADVFATIADSDIGTPLFAGLAALALFNRSIMLTQKLVAATWGPGVAALKTYHAELSTVITAQDRATLSTKELAAAEKTRDTAQASLVKNSGRAALAAGGLAIAMSGVAEGTGFANTAMLAMAGPWGAAAGFALDLWHATDEVEASIEGLNAAMAAGDLTALTSELTTAQAKLDEMSSDRDTKSLGEDLLGPFAGLTDAEYQLSDLTGETDDLKDSVAKARLEARELARAQAEVAAGAPTLIAPLAGVREGMEKAAEAARDESDALQESVDAMRAKRQEALRALDAELNYQAAIDDARKSLKENGKTVDETTDKGRENLRNLYALADGWNQQSDAAKNAKGALQSARQNFIETATAMGMAEDKAKRLANRLFEIPTKRQIDITLDAGQATAALIALKARMDAIKDKHVTVTVNSVRPQGGQVPTDEQAGRSAAGGRGRTSRLPDGLVNPRAGDLSTASTAYALHALDGLARHADGAAGRLKTLKDRLAESEKALDRERTKRDALQSQFDSIASQVGGAYSPLDPFAQAQSTGWAWGAGSGGANPLASFDAALAGNTATTTAAQTALGTASGNGLDGPLYAALAASGNLQLLQAFAGLSSQQIDQREQAFAAQSAAQSGLGTMAAQAEVGTQLADANKSLVDIRQEVRDLRHDVKQADQNNVKGHDRNAEKVGDKVNGAASNAHRRRNR